MSRRHLFRVSVRARLATAAIVVGLVAAGGVVWLSPSTAADAPQLSAEAQAVADQNGQLTAQLESLRDSLEAREQELADLKASDAKAAAERAAGAASGQAKAEAERAAAQEAEQAAAQKAESERQAAAQEAESERQAAALTAAEKRQAAADARQAAAVAAARGAAKAEAERAAGAASGLEKADLEKALADAEGDAEGAQIRADAAEADAARARDALARAQANTPAAPQPAAKPTAPSREALLAPTQRYYGLYTTQSPFNWAEYDDVTTKVGIAPTIAGYFQGWDGDFRPDAVTRAWAKGALPLLTWESRPLKAGNDQAVDPDYSLPVILSGRYDEYLHQYARDIVALGLPLAIRLDHEMNGSWYPWGERRWGGDSLNGNGKGDYVKMWRHVHDIFEAEGANQYVIWIWAPNIVNSLPSYAKNSSWYMKSLYPGDDYVDWVGLSGYYRPPYKADQTPTFDYTYGPSLAQLRSITSKPILLAEVGASEVGGKKPQWVADFFDAFTRPENADVIGFAWFNETVTTITGGERVTNDWRIVSRADSRQAFVDGIHDPAAGFVAAPAATAEPTPSAEPSPSASASPTASPTATATSSPTPSPTTSLEP